MWNKKEVDEKKRLRPRVPLFRTARLPGPLQPAFYHTHPCDGWTGSVAIRMSIKIGRPATPGVAARAHALCGGPPHALASVLLSLLLPGQALHHAGDRAGAGVDPAGLKVGHFVCACMCGSAWMKKKRAKKRMKSEVACFVFSMLEGVGGCVSFARCLPRPPHTKERRVKVSLSRSLSLSPVLPKKQKASKIKVLKESKKAAQRFYFSK